MLESALPFSVPQKKSEHWIFKLVLFNLECISRPLRISLKFKFLLGRSSAFLTSLQMLLALLIHVPTLAIAMLYTRAEQPKAAQSSNLAYYLLWYRL
jgi:hypothetical protein